MLRSPEINARPITGEKGKVEGNREQGIEVERVGSPQPLVEDQPSGRAQCVDVEVPPMCAQHQSSLWIPA